MPPWRRGACRQHPDHHRPRAAALKAFDAEPLELVIARGAGAGIELQRSTTITAIDWSQSDEVTEERSGHTETMEIRPRRARRPDTPSDELGPQLGPCRLGPGMAYTSAHLQSTTNPAVYAAGDSANTPGMPLTPVAVIVGKVAASNMLKATTTVGDYAGAPTAVFTRSRARQGCMLEQRARAQGIDLKVPYTARVAWYSNYRIGETTAAAKVVIDRSSDQILGAHLLGPDGNELTNFLGLAMKLDLTTRQLKAVTAAHPTVG